MHTTKYNRAVTKKVIHLAQVLQKYNGSVLAAPWFLQYYFTK